MSKVAESKFIRKDIFKGKFGIKSRDVTLESTGDTLRVKPLSMVVKREIREANMRGAEVGKMARGDATEAGRILDVESYMVDLIIASCQEPKFDETDKLWFMERADSNFVQELYGEIDTPVKLNQLDENTLGN